MTAAFLHFGPRTPEQTAWDLVAEERARHWDDWRRSVADQPRPEALAAEARPHRTGGAP